jgi:flagellar secretion chaperone FliS
MQPQGIASKLRGQYGRIGLEAEVASASPHRLVEMLLDGALARIAKAQVHLERGETAEKGATISFAMQIIDGLRASLDMQRGGEIAANLDRLYDYMLRRLLEANLHGSSEMLTEVSGLLQEIRSGWVGIRTQVDGQRGEVENSLTGLSHTAG